MTTAREPGPTREPGAARVPGGILALLRRLGGVLQLMSPLLVWCLLGGYMGLIWWASSRRPRFQIPGVDLRGVLTNLAHAPEFAALTVLSCLTLARHRLPWLGTWPAPGRDARSLVLAIPFLYPVLDELHQSHVPGRDADVFDVFTDWTAVIATLVVVSYVGRPDATGKGLVLRLALFSLACVACALLASYAPELPGLFGNGDSRTVSG